MRSRTVCAVSIHAPLARSNGMRPCDQLHGSVSIHAPLARSNRINCNRDNAKRFQYMLLLRGATSCGVPGGGICLVSIHAPLARSNKRWLSFMALTCLFQYMLLLRGATSPPIERIKLRTVSIHAPLARSNRGNINRSGSKCKSKNRAKYQLSFVKEHYSILRFLIIV